MAAELLQHRDSIAAELEHIRRRIPMVSVSYRDRLLDRVRALVAEMDLQIDRARAWSAFPIQLDRSAFWAIKSSP